MELGRQDRLCVVPDFQESDGIEIDLRRILYPVADVGSEGSGDKGTGLSCALPKLFADALFRSSLLVVAQLMGTT